ncbi:hypothetical protein FB451DRAFT_491116 [Mycena latifolia]|nr:hypothetical protein FB451DRAFT_491116 [Mycena latifolia]
MPVDLASSLPFLPSFLPSFLSQAIDMDAVRALDLARLPVFLPALLLLCAAYPLLAPRFKTQRQTAWLLTTLASALMTAAALPFVRDYALGGVAGVQPRAAFAGAVNRFFQAYLAADLLMGALWYREQVGLLTGWVHHAVYIGITEVAIRAGWAHIFCLCACMELPTLLLGLSTLFPRTRSNALFALTFFATRIVLHLVLLFSYGVTRPGVGSSPSMYNSTAASATSASAGGGGGGAGGVQGGVGGVQVGAGSYVPAAILTLVFPLHAMWFVGCVKGFVKRAKARAAAAPTSAAVVPPKDARHPLAPDIYPDARGLARHAFRPSLPVSPWAALSSPWLSVDSPRLRRLRARVSTLSASSPFSLSALDRNSLVLAVNRRMGVHVSGYVAPARPIRPRARAMARRVSESLIERGERAREVVLGAFGVGG